MGKIDDAIRTIEGIENGTERAMQLAGLLSTLFKIKGVVLVITGRLAFDGYANTTSAHPTLDLGALGCPLPPRTVLEVMRGQLPAHGTLHHWMLADIPIRLGENPTIVHRELCRDFTTDLGVVKLAPVEEILANLILASIYPEPDGDAHQRAHLLLMNGLTEAFQMNWSALHALCHRPEYRVGEELAQMRLAAKRDVDAAGLSRDHVGETMPIPNPAEPPVAPEETPAADEMPAALEPEVTPIEEAPAFAEPLPAAALAETLPAPDENEVVDLSKVDPKLLLGEASA